MNTILETIWVISLILWTIFCVEFVTSLIKRDSDKMFKCSYGMLFFALILNMLK